VARELGGRYQVVRPLGRGGMGAVYLARDLALHRVVAIKVLLREMRGRPDACERFRREARLAAQLSHPNIIPLHDFGETPELMYMVMPYVHGESLAERVRRLGRLSPEETRRILAELAGALDHAHARGVVHRDLKPENIVLEGESGRPMLADFGVARRGSWDIDPEEARHAFGTPHFMSPEQVTGEPDIDGRSDLYALGVLGYLLLSGRLPFDGASFGEVTAKHLVERPEPLLGAAPNAPDDLIATIERCLAKEPSARWRRAGDLRAALTAPRARRRAWPRLAALAALLVVVARVVGELLA
jgi:serine/threonine-protein kinase